MTISRRQLTFGLGATTLLGACTAGGSPKREGPSAIDARSDATLAQLYRDYPATQKLGQDAKGVLVMPLVTEAGLGFGGAYGRGALRVGGQTVDYYSVFKATGGLQIGAQQYAHVLFFMTDGALDTFRRSPGFAAGANIEYATPAKGETFGAETTTSLAPIIAIVFGQSGLRLGATLEGVKYTRIYP